MIGSAEFHRQLIIYNHNYQCILICTSYVHVNKTPNGLIVWPIIATTHNLLHGLVDQTIGFIGGLICICILILDAPNPISKSEWE